MADIVGIGASVHDTLLLMDAYPAEDSKAKAGKTLIQGGGPCATALVAAAKLGLTASYMGTTGNDPYGRFLLDDLRTHGVNTDHIQLVPDALSFHSVIWVSESAATRTCVWNPGTVPPPEPASLDLDAIRKAKALHLDGHMLEAAIHGAKAARDAGVIVSLDAGSAIPGIERLLPLVDLLIPSEAFALRITGAATAEQAATQLYALYHPKLVLITQGKDGGVLLNENGPRRYPAFSVPAIDTNGAGDTFHGAFLAAYLRGMDPDRAARYASAASALTCMGFGTRCSMPNDAQVNAFLTERTEAAHA